MFVADSGSMSHMVNSLKNMTKLQELKIVVKKENKKVIMGSLQGYWKEYQEIYCELYPVTCIDTAYIPALSVNIFSVTHTLTKGFNVMS